MFHSVFLKDKKKKKKIVVSSRGRASRTLNHWRSISGKGVIGGARLPKNLSRLLSLIYASRANVN